MQRFWLSLLPIFSAGVWPFGNSSLLSSGGGKRSKRQRKGGQFPDNKLAQLAALEPRELLSTGTLGLGSLSQQQMGMAGATNATVVLRGQFTETIAPTTSPFYTLELDRNNDGVVDQTQSVTGSMSFTMSTVAPFGGQTWGLRATRNFGTPQTTPWTKFNISVNAMPLAQTPIVPLAGSGSGSTSGSGVTTSGSGSGTASGSGSAMGSSSGSIVGSGTSGSGSTGSGTTSGSGTSSGGGTTSASGSGSGAATSGSGSATGSGSTTGSGSMSGSGSGTGSGSGSGSLASNAAPVMSIVRLTNDTGTPDDNITTDARITTQFADPDGASAYILQFDWNNDNVADWAVSSVVKDTLTVTDLNGRVPSGLVNLRARATQIAGMGVQTAGAWQPLTFTLSSASGSGSGSMSGSGSATGSGSTTGSGSGTGSTTGSGSGTGSGTGSSSGSGTGTASSSGTGTSTGTGTGSGTGSSITSGTSGSSGSGTGTGTVSGSASGSGSGSTTGMTTSGGGSTPSNTAEMLKIITDFTKEFERKEVELKEKNKQQFEETLRIIRTTFVDKMAEIDERRKQLREQSALLLTQAIASTTTTTNNSLNNTKQTAENFLNQATQKNQQLKQLFESETAAADTRFEVARAQADLDLQSAIANAESDFDDASESALEDFLAESERVVAAYDVRMEQISDAFESAIEASEAVRDAALDAANGTAEQAVAGLESSYNGAIEAAEQALGVAIAGLGPIDLSGLMSDSGYQTDMAQLSGALTTQLDSLYASYAAQSSSTRQQYQNQLSSLANSYSSAQSSREATRLSRLQAALTARQTAINDAQEAFNQAVERSEQLATGRIEDAAEEYQTNVAAIQSTLASDILAERDRATQRKQTTQATLNSEKLRIANQLRSDYESLMNTWLREIEGAARSASGTAPSVNSQRAQLTSLISSLSSSSLSGAFTQMGASIASAMTTAKNQYNSDMAQSLGVPSPSSSSTTQQMQAYQQAIQDRQRAASERYLTAAAAAINSAMSSAEGTLTAAIESIYGPVESLINGFADAEKAFHIGNLEKQSRVQKAQEVGQATYLKELASKKSAALAQLKTAELAAQTELANADPDAEDAIAAKQLAAIKELNREQKALNDVILEERERHRELILTERDTLARELRSAGVGYTQSKRQADQQFLSASLSAKSTVEQSISQTLEQAQQADQQVRAQALAGLTSAYSAFATQISSAWAGAVNRLNGNSADAGTYTSAHQSFSQQALSAASGFLSGLMSAGNAYSTAALTAENQFATESDQANSNKLNDEYAASTATDDALADALALGEDQLHDAGQQLIEEVGEAEDDQIEAKDKSERDHREDRGTAAEKAVTGANEVIRTSAQAERNATLEGRTTASTKSLGLAGELLGESATAAAAAIDAWLEEERGKITQRIDLLKGDVKKYKENQKASVATWASNLSRQIRDDITAGTHLGNVPSLVSTADYPGGWKSTLYYPQSFLQIQQNNLRYQAELMSQSASVHSGGSAAFRLLGLNQNLEAFLYNGQVVAYWNSYRNEYVWTINGQEYGKNRGQLEFFFNPNNPNPRTADEIHSFWTGRAIDRPEPQTTGQWIMDITGVTGYLADPNLSVFGVATLVATDIVGILDPTGLADGIQVMVHTSAGNHGQAAAAAIGMAIPGGFDKLARYASRLPANKVDDAVKAIGDFKKKADDNGAEIAGKAAKAKADATAIKVNAEKSLESKPGQYRFDNGGGCFVGGTLVQVAALAEVEEGNTPKHRNTLAFAGNSQQTWGNGNLSTIESVAPAITHSQSLPIEDVPLGARIAATNPEGAVREFFSEPNELTWLKLSLTIERENRSPVDVELLRPAEVVGHLAVGDHLPLEIGELEVSGFAVVTAIEACPPIAAGPGEVVTGRYITRLVDEIAHVHLASGDTLSGTPIHPVWVINQQAFVPLAELTAGDLLDTDHGPIAVKRVETVYRPQPVYNLEINAEHVYRVGDVGVLVHNSNAPGDCTPLAQLKSRYSDELPSLDGTGKVHGVLPHPEDLGKYDPYDLAQLRDELEKSVQERIRKTVDLGSDFTHGERQAMEQQLIFSIDKFLSGS